MIADASGRSGSKKKIQPSTGLGAKEREPETIWIITASPSALAVASTVAATIAGRIAFRVTAITARTGLTPRATAPSRQDLGTEASASQISAIMIGVIITVRITTATASPAPVSSTTFWTDTFSEVVIRLLPTNGTRTSTPISP